MYHINRHYPIGLLFDIHALQATSIKKETKLPLPWRVTVHSQNFPGEKLIKNPTLKSCQDYFMSMIKEVRTRRRIDILKELEVK